MDIKQQQNIERIKQRLTRLMLLSMIITLLLFAAVITTIIYKVKQESKLNNISPTQTIDLPKDSEILGQNLDSSKLSLLIKNNNQFFITIYDYKKAKILTKIKLSN